jgi:hypothetical protein
LTILKPVISSLRLQLSVGGERKTQRGVGTAMLSREAQLETYNALCQVYGVYDRLLLSNMIPEEQKAPFKKERAILSAFIFKHKERGTGESVASTKEGRKPRGEEADLHSYLKDEGEGEGESEEVKGEGEKKEARPEPWKRKDTAPWIEREQKKPAEWKMKDTAPWKGRDGGSRGDRESWRTQRSKPEGQRKPWSS